ncbi:MAG: acetylxylan esterase [Victivallaceae bacterium]|nr:acetylxylan esterase [Victivallaceae bacterium]
MRRVCAVVGMWAVCASAAFGKVEISPDRPDAIYKYMETARITLRSDVPVKVSVASNYQDPASFDVAPGETVFEVKGRLPGFVIVSAEAENDGGRAACGIGFSPELLPPDTPEPADFDRFWAAAIKKADKIPLDPQLEEMPEFSNEKYKAYRVSFANIDNTRIYGFMTVPNGEGPYPIYCSVPGAGPNDVKPISKFNDRAITLVINVFPFPLPPSREEAGKLIEQHYPNYDGYWANPPADPEKFFFYRAILGANRAFDYAASLPKFDHKHMVYWGSSQGGAMGMVLSALNRNITAAVLNVPADYGRIYTDSYYRTGDPTMLKLYPYFADQNFARRVNIPIMSSAGMVDCGCTPEKVSRFFNLIPSKQKELRFIPAMGHDFDPDYEHRTEEFIGRYLEL